MFATSSKALLAGAASLTLAVTPLPAQSSTQGWTSSSELKLPAYTPPLWAFMGEQVALSGDTALVSAAGNVDVFERQPTGTWLPVKTLTGSPLLGGGDFGSALALEGDVAIVGAPNEPLQAGQGVKGAAYVFERDFGGPGNWGQSARLVIVAPGPGHFGASVALSGNVLAVGASASNLNNEAVYVFERTGAGSPWTQLAKHTGYPGDFGQALALVGDTLFTGAPRNDNVGGGGGAVFVFERNQGGPNAWGQSDALAAGDASNGNVAQFGASLAVDGSTLLIGAPGNTEVGPGSGAAYVFERQNASASWSETAKLVPSDGWWFDGFGSAAALDEDLAAIGVWRDVHAPFVPGTNLSEGSIYLFERNRDGLNQWGEALKLVASDPQTGDHFGHSLSVEGQRIFTGARGVGEAIPELAGLAHHSDGLYGTNTFDDTLAFVSFLNNPHGLFGDIQGLAHLPGVGILGQGEGFYGSDLESGNLIWLSVESAAPFSTTFVGPIGFDNVRGLALDPATKVLYGAHTEPSGASQLITIDRSTGAGTLVGNIGFDQIEGLAYDSEAGELYGSSTATGVLVRIDASTGAGTGVGPLGFDEVKGLAFDAYSKSLVGADAATRELIHIDQAAGTGLAGGSYAGSNGRGTAYVVELDFLPETYCTAGVSSKGCRAFLSAQGTPSASAMSGFTLTASLVQGGINGIYYYGTAGRQANPWGNGSSFQCVAPPVRRTGLLKAGGSGTSCTGVFQQDLNAFWCPTCPKAHKNPGAGTRVQAQLWYRDIQSTSNQTTSLSDAIEFQMNP